MCESNLFLQTIEVTGHPENGLKPEDGEALDVISTILDLNFYTISQFVDDDVQHDPHFFTERSELESEISKLFALLHNYLATLYSYNENLVNILPHYLPPGSEQPTIGKLSATTNNRPRQSQYDKKFNFLLGLRTEAQHGTFCGFEVDSTPWDESRVKHHLKFNEGDFLQSTRLDDMEKYLRHTNVNEREFIISFIAGFHRNEWQEFHEGVLNWLERYGL